MISGISDDDKEVNIFLGDLQHDKLSQCYGNIEPMLATLQRHWLNVSCLLGHNINISTHYVFCFSPAEKIQR